MLYYFDFSEISPSPQTLIIIQAIDAYGMKRGTVTAVNRARHEVQSIRPDLSSTGLIQLRILMRTLSLQAGRLYGKREATTPTLSSTHI